MLSAFPTPERIALNRMAHGARPGDEERVRSIGLPAYVEEQLRPPPSSDPLTQARLAQTTLAIAYGAGTKYPAVAESRRLALLDQPIETLWALQSQVRQGNLPQAEANRASRPRHWRRASTSS